MDQMNQISELIFSLLWLLYNLIKKTRIVFRNTLKLHQYWIIYLLSKR